MRIHQAADASMCRGWFELHRWKFSEELTLSTWLEMISLYICSGKCLP